MSESTIIKIIGQCQDKVEARHRLAIQVRVGIADLSEAAYWKYGNLPEDKSWSEFAEVGSNRVERW